MIGKGLSTTYFSSSSLLPPKRPPPLIPNKSEPTRPRVKGLEEDTPERNEIQRSRLVNNRFIFLDFVRGKSTVVVMVVGRGYLCNRQDRWNVEEKVNTVKNIIICCAVRTSPVWMRIDWFHPRGGSVLEHFGTRSLATCDSVTFGHNMYQ